MIKFDSNYIGNQHWYIHLVGGVQGLRVTILSVKGTKNEGVPLPFFEVIHMKCVSSLHSILRRTIVQFTFLLMLQCMSLLWRSILDIHCYQFQWLTLLMSIFEIYGLSMPKPSWGGLVSSYFNLRVELVYVLVEISPMEFQCNYQIPWEHRLVT